VMFSRFVWRSVPVLYFTLLVGFSQAAEYLPSPGRLPGGALWKRTDVGVQGGIPDSSRMPVHATLPSTATAAQINSAISTCPAGSVVQLQAGTFSLTERVSMKSGVVLRGAGPSRTILNFTGGGGYNNGLISFAGPFQDAPPIVKSLIGGMGQGSTVLTLNNVTGLAVGDLVGIDQLNDANIGVENVATFTSRSGGIRGQGQNVMITAINGSAITISHPILMTNYNSAAQPEVWRIGSPMRNAGVENMKLVNVDQDNADFNIYIQGGFNCWIKDVHSVAAERSHMRAYQCVRIEVRHSLFQRTKSYASQSYGMNVTYSSFCLVEDNIFEEVTSPVNLWGSGTCGNVIAYNYTQNMRLDAAPAWLSENVFTHGCHPSMNLVEGNHLTTIYWDYIWGSASHNTAFRNRVTGWEAGKAANTFPICAERNNRFETYAGNVLGMEGIHTRYKLAGTAQTGLDNYIYVFGYAGTDQESLTGYDPQVAATAVLKGNYNYADHAINSAENLGGDTMRASWYQDSKPAWFGDRPWPWVNPNNPALAVATNLPAGYRFIFGVDPPGAGNGGGGNQSPSAIAGANPTTGGAPLTVNFSSAGSSDPEGALLTYSWVFGDGAISTSPNPTHVYESNGTYVARLTVSDGTNTASAGDIAISVRTPGNPFIASYSFDESSGTTVTDASGNGHNGTIVGATRTSAGRRGGALEFNGTSSFVSVNPTPAMDLTSGMTLSAWVKPTALGGWRPIILKSELSYVLHGSGSQSSAPNVGGTFASANLFGPVALPLNTWSHLAATYDGATLRLYVDGNLVASRAQTGAIQPSSGALHIGADPVFNAFWAGAIDEVRIYDRALSDTEVKREIGPKTPEGFGFATPTP
jgi:PKD repeat protein